MNTVARELGVPNSNECTPQLGSGSSGYAAEAMYARILKLTAGLSKMKMVLLTGSYQEKDENFKGGDKHISFQKYLNKKTFTLHKCLRLTRFTVVTKLSYQNLNACSPQVGVCMDHSKSKVYELVTL